MDKKQAGSKGGKTTFQKYGSTHMQTIGAKGARTTWSRYHLLPYGQTEYAMTERATGKIIRIITR